MAAYDANVRRAVIVYCIRLGHSIGDTARFFGISEVTVSKYKRKYHEEQRAIQELYDESKRIRNQIEKEQKSDKWKAAFRHYQSEEAREIQRVRAKNQKRNVSQRFTKTTIGGSG